MIEVRLRLSKMEIEIPTQEITYLLFVSIQTDQLIKLMDQQNRKKSLFKEVKR
jgi:hypothetical protein